MNKIVRKSISLKEELSVVRERMLGPKVGYPTKLRKVNRRRPLFFTHFFRCCSCCPCKICRSKGRNSNTNINLPSSPGNIYPLPSSFTITTSRNRPQMPSKYSRPATYQSVCNGDNKRRCKFFIFNF